MKKILILVGPQGSGNHMWSKIFALHPLIYGWQDLVDEFWIGHDREPFAECWADIEQLDNFDWNQSDYYVTSMSIPYMNNGVPTIPTVYQFGIKLQAQGFDVQIAVIGRDRNILEHQETRVRGQPTYQQAIDTIQNLSGFKTVFLSYELLQLYREQYLEQIELDLAWPMALDDPRLKEIIETDSNSKYFQKIDHHWVDDLAKKTSAKWHD
jgi:hypothetical protein